MVKNFRPKAGAHLTSQQAIEYGKRIDWLAGKQAGSITPTEVLEDAKNKTSPLHGFFEWDDSLAAEKWRVSQANYLLRSIEIVVTRSDGTELQVRNYYSITEETEEGTQQSYYMLGVVLNDQEKRESVIAAAYRELESWRMRYEQYQEFNNICQEIARFKK